MMFFCDSASNATTSSSAASVTFSATPQNDVADFIQKLIAMLQKLAGFFDSLNAPVTQAQSGVPQAQTKGLTLQRDHDFKLARIREYLDAHDGEEGVVLPPIAWMSSSLRTLPYSA